MKISTISSTFGYTLDTYSLFNPVEYIADDDYSENTEVNFPAYRHDLAELQVEVLNNYTDKVVQGFTHIGDYSPREYNFSTDNSELEVTFDDKRLMDYVNEHRPEFEQYLKDNFTSYDGFMGFVANTWDDFFDQLKAGDATDHDRNWAIMAGWYFKRECLSLDDYLNDMFEGVREVAYENTTGLSND